MDRVAVSDAAGSGSIPECPTKTPVLEFQGGRSILRTRSDDNAQHNLTESAGSNAGAFTMFRASSYTWVSLCASFQECAYECAAISNKLS